MVKAIAAVGELQNTVDKHDLAIAEIIERLERIERRFAETPEPTPP